MRNLQIHFIQMRFFGLLSGTQPNDKHKPPRRLRGKPLCQQTRPKARFPFAGTRRRRGRLDAMLGNFFIEKTTISL